MPFDPTERRRIGQTDVEVTRLGLGGASIGGLYAAVTDNDNALATIDRAWNLGIRYFDTAPLYGYGASERRMGRVLRQRPRDEFALSTKVGRLIRPEDRIPAGADIDPQRHAGREDAFYPGTGPVKPVFDYSRDGIERSIEESLERLGLDRIDIALIHDPDDHWQVAIGEAYPALHRLREQGTVRAIGAGMNHSAMLARFAREADFDVFMLAGRYTLFDQDDRRSDEQRNPRRAARRRDAQLRAGIDLRDRARAPTGGGLRTTRHSAQGGGDAIPPRPPCGDRPRRRGPDGCPSRRLPDAATPTDPGRPLDRSSRRRAAARRGTDARLMPTL
jgi:aryl-alcohol dehydrogenase-like predicted oxidoreductase